MSLISFADPWSFETPDARKERESTKFRSAANSILEDFQRKRDEEERLRREQESARFREAIQPQVMEIENQQAEAASRNAESQRFREMVQPEIEAFSVRRMFEDRQRESEKFREAVQPWLQSESPSGRFNDRLDQNTISSEQITTADEQLRRAWEEDQGAPHGEPNFPGIAGKIPGFRNPAELASTVGTAGMGIPGSMAARALKAGAMTAAGSLGALAGGKAAEEVGAPEWTGELAGGLVGGGVGLSAGSRAARAIDEQGGYRALGKRFLEEEAGAIKLPGSRSPEEIEASMKAKLAATLNENEGVRAQQAILRSKELGARVGNADALEQQARDAGASPIEAVLASQSALKGKMPTLFAAGFEKFDVEERALIEAKVVALPRFKKTNLANMFEDMAKKAAMSPPEPRPIREFEARYLREAVGEDIAAQMVAVSKRDATIARKIAKGDIVLTEAQRAFPGTDVPSVEYPESLLAASGDQGTMFSSSIPESQMANPPSERALDFQELQARIGEQPQPLGETPGFPTATVSDSNVLPSVAAESGEQQLGLGLPSLLKSSSKPTENEELRKILHAYRKAMVRGIENPSPGTGKFEYPSYTTIEQTEIPGLTAATKPNGQPLKVSDELLSIPGLSMAIKASFDMGARFRQSLVLGFSHPRQWLSNWKPVANALFSEKAAQRSLRQLEANPWYSITAEGAEKQGLGFKDVGGHMFDWTDATPGGERVAGFTGMHDSFLSRAARRIPGLRGSERAFAVDLNKAAVEVYASEAQAMWNAGIRDPKMYEGVAKVINHARGYGSFNPGQIVQGVNAFFSGRNLVAKFQVVLDPFVQPGSLLKPGPRQLAAKNLAGLVAGDLTLLGFVGGALTLTGLGSVEFNPMKPGADWLKVRVGNTRVDPWGGFLPMARLMARMGAATLTETGIKETRYDMSDVRRELGNFFANKEAPVVRLFTDLAGISQPFEPRKLLSVRTLVDLYAPFIAEDVWDAVKQGNWLLTPAVAGLSAVGMGVSSYQTGSEKFRNAFKETTGREYNPQEGDRLIAEDNPQLEPLLRQWEKEQLGRKAEPAVARQEREAILAEQEKATQLPQIAAAVRQNQPGAGMEFREAYKDLQTTAAIMVMRDLYGADLRQPETPQGKILQQYRDVNPNNYRDPLTFETDWGRFYADRETLFAQLTPELQRAMKARLMGTDENVRAVEPRYKQAVTDYRAYNEIPKYLGLSAEDGRQVDEVMRAVEYIALTQDLRQSRTIDRSRGARTVSDEAPPLDKRAALDKLNIDSRIRGFIEDNLMPGSVTHNRGRSSGGMRTQKQERVIQNPERDLFAQFHQDLFYFGLVSPSTLTQQERATLPDSILLGNVNRQLVGAR